VLWTSWSLRHRCAGRSPNSQRRRRPNVLVGASIVPGSRRTSRTLFRRDALRTTLVAVHRPGQPGRPRAEYRWGRGFEGVSPVMTSSRPRGLLARRSSCARAGLPPTCADADAGRQHTGAAGAAGETPTLSGEVCPVSWSWSRRRIGRGSPAPRTAPVEPAVRLPSRYVPPVCSLTDANRRQGFHGLQA
jgi:hypothetical protein